MIYQVQFAQQALDQLEQLEDYISDAASPIVAARYIDALVAYCEDLSLFPLRGRPREDLLPGLRTTNYRSRAVIAYRVNTDAHSVSILGVFYGGQDYETLIGDE